MAIPKETSKELIVVVDNDTLDVVITPPVIDSAIVVGAPPPTDGRTLLFNGFTGDTMRVRTVDGLNFEIDPVQEAQVVTVDQIIVAEGDPGSLDGQYDGRVYVDDTNNSIFVWSGGTAWPNPQLIVRSSDPASGTNDGEVLINSTTKSIKVWSA